MAGPMAIVGVGASIAQGFLGAKGASEKAKGDQLAIQGQMLAAMGKAFQYDVEAQQFQWKSGLEKYQAAVSKINMDVSKENATYERDKGEVEAQMLGMKQAQARGELIASQGASGISVGSGSSARVREGMIEVGYHDQGMVRANAARTAYGFEVQAMGHEAEAAMHSMASDFDLAQAENATTAAGIARQALPLLEQSKGLAATAGNINMASSLVSAAGSVASKWTQSSFQGMLPSSMQG